MLDLELASRITIITNRALCGGEAALLARIADFAAAGAGEIVVREKDLDEAAYAALFGKILLACKSGFCADTARADGIIANEACTAKFGKIQALEGELDVSAAYADKILLCERGADEVSRKKLDLGGDKSELCADTARKHGAATDEIRSKNSACVLDEILSENFTSAANCANDSAPGEISLRGAASETKLATEGVRGAENAERMQGAQSTENANDVHSAKNAGSSQSAEGAQSAERSSHQPAIFVHNFADFALRAGERNLWLPLGVLRSFSAAHGAEFLRANFKKLVASCHSEAEAREALELGANAICLSHIFATDCKAGLAPKGLNLIRAVREFFAGEIYALGGITPHNFASVLRAGADRIAVMSPAMAARDASDFIRKFKK
ncbi:MAG: thiamine phosphate synthase [Campylobacter gracilis]|uniref:thiamine phosphate synthase n=1 Tax=Campylobacter gracilis TaxID=824 RepID=UPI0026F2DA4D|nr:thiamine phosphate synthase [Campylobacter gracilis]MBS6153400.1 thiamine phosphate synthase [Campylobacter gracilis]